MLPLSEKAASTLGEGNKIVFYMWLEIKIGLFSTDLIIMVPEILIL